MSAGGDLPSQMTKKFLLSRGAEKLTGRNLIVVSAKFSRLFCKLDQVYVTQMSVYQMHINPISADQMSVYPTSFTVDKIVFQMFVDLMNVNQTTDDEMSSEQRSVNKCLLSIVYQSDI
jgi:hypothetical protein